ncbi:PKD1 isoform 5, partial [Pongo abelii]
LLGTNVQVEAAPATLELVCPSSVQSDESLELSIQNRGGSGLEAAYSIVALGEEPARVVHPLCPSDTEIFPGNGHCYRLVVEKAAWLQAQEQCRAWAGAALAMVDSPAVQRFLVSRVTRGRRWAQRRRARPSAWRAARTGCPGSHTQPQPSTASGSGPPGGVTQTCAQHRTATSVSCGPEAQCRMPRTSSWERPVGTCRDP